MNDDACIAFLQDVLPRLGLRWEGFRKPRGQVCKRIVRRMAELGIGSLDDYRRRLDDDPDEWDALDFFCRVTISRFRRDHGLWRRLEESTLPRIASRLGDGARLRAWSAGCASGEEPHTLSILWRLALAERFPGVELFVVATDLDPHMLFRARRAVYPPGNLKELPDAWRDAAFEPAERPEDADELRLLPRFRRDVHLAGMDLRAAMPRGPFHLVLCRNLAFTYFEEDLQERVARDLVARLADGGCLAVGAHETLPAAARDAAGLHEVGDGLYAS